MDNDIKNTIDNGESDVQVATIGTVVGSTIDGEPIEQNFTESALQKIAEETSEEILVDADHQSETGGDTSAKGWLSNLKFVPGKGLFGKIKWTDIGRKLIENRVFRWLSPSWLLSRDTMEPVKMTSCALTNRPSQKGRIDPIVNSTPIEQDFNPTKDVLTMTIEELKDLIKSTIEELHAEKVEEHKEAVEEAAEKTEEEPKEEPKTDEEIIEEVKKEEQISENTCTTENTCTEAKNEEVKAEEEEEKKVEEVKEDVKEEEPKKEEKEEPEIIKIESLNSAPTVPTMLDEPAWKKMTPDEFVKWFNNGRK